MQVQLIKSNGQTDTVFNVVDVHVNHSTNELVIMFSVNGSIHTIGFKAEEWNSFITSK